MAWTGVVTDAGAQLFGSGLALVVDSVRTGNDAWDSSLGQKTSLKSQKDGGPSITTGSQTVVEGKEVLSGSVIFKIRIGAAPSAVGAYTMKEFGLFMNSAGNSPVMVAYFKDATGVSIPSQATFNDFSYSMTVTLAVSTSSTISLTVPANALVSQDTFEAAVESLETAIAAKVAANQGSGNSGKALMVGNDGTVSPASIDMVGATSSADGSKGLVPKPLKADRTKFLMGNGTWAVPTDTTYTAASGGGLSLSGTAFSLANTAVTQGSYGMSNATTGSNGTQVSIPYITVDAKGRITGAANKTLTLVDTTYTAGTGLALNSGVFSLADSGVTSGSYGPPNDASGSVAIPYITVDAKGRITSIQNKSFDAPNTTYSAAAGGGLSLAGTAFSLTDTGVTARAYGPTADVTGNNGSTIKIPQITVDSKGRITSIVERTYTSVDNNDNTTYTAGNGLGLNGTQFYMTGSFTGDFTATRVFNAVWNDYAEYREGAVLTGGLCVRESKDGIMKLSTKRLQSGCRLTSDTFGASMGKTTKAQTPVAIAGRVLAYPTNRKKFKLGKAVCSAPGGMVDVMSRLECILFPDRIIGYVSEIPEYDYWMAGSKEEPVRIKVDGRVWVYVR